jgi:hypothetical protein
MACETYADRVADAVLGALPASEHAALIAHLEACEACRDAFRRASELTAFVDRGMDSLVEGAPSPGFELRLRARLAQETIPERRVWLARTMVAAVAMALAGVVLLGAIHTFRNRNSGPAIAWQALRPAPLAAENAPAHDRGMSIRRPRPAHVASARPARANEPGVLIDRSQLAAIQEFANAVAAGRVDGAELISASQKIQKPLNIRVLDIPPIENTTQDGARSTDD